MYCDKYRHLPEAYLVYYYRGEIKIKHGNVGGNFYPDNEDRWMTGIPNTFGEISRKGKILVKNKEDLPKAMERLKNYYLSKTEQVTEEYVRRISNLNKLAWR